MDHAEPAAPFHFGKNTRSNCIAASASIALAVFFASIIATFIRPIGLPLAPFWPANAVMVGLLIRLPQARKMVSWIGAAAAFFCADLLMGTSLEMTVVLNLVNLASIGAAYSVFIKLPVRVVEMRDSASVPCLLLGSMAGALTGGLGGMAANPFLFGGGIKNGWEFWCVTELANYITVLPLILAAPGSIRTLVKLPSFSLTNIAPVAALAFSCIAGHLIGGPGAILFVVPALLWCGLSYSVYMTAFLTMICGYWVLSELVAAYLPVAEQSTESFGAVSYRLGVSLMMLAPVMQSVTSSARRSTIDNLWDVAHRDELTGIANRRAFLSGAPKIIEQSNGMAAVMLLDIDHFKLFNDRFGHSAGDAILVELVQRVSHCLRSCDLFGRLGGEEFAVIIPECAPEQAWLIAERIRTSVKAKTVSWNGNEDIQLTVSIGLANASHDHETIDQLLKMADAALYSAKNDGRDRVQLFVQDDEAR